jgi:CubicO group peptidase (beta-lactamase class C family)
MRGKWIGALCIATLVSACGGGDGPAPARLAQEALQARLEQTRADGGLPGLTLLTVDGEAIETISASGGAARLRPDDLLQTGSQTKAVTAMLLARLVERNRLRWDSTLAELFPEWGATMQPALRDVTVAQLLRHRGGLQRDIEEADGKNLLPLATGDLVTDRTTAIGYMLRQPLATMPGSTALYSNVGYMLAGLIAERAGGAPFETLVQQEVFAPLGVTATFGFPEDLGTTVGHVWHDGVWRPADFPAQDRYNMARIMAAAGGMTISMPEYGKLLREQLRGLRGYSTFLDKATFELIHSAQDRYGFGWAASDVPGNGRVSAHAGSWGSYYVFAIVVPGADRAVAVASNCFGQQAVEQLDELTRRLALQ